VIEIMAMTRRVEIALDVDQLEREIARARLTLEQPVRFDYTVADLILQLRQGAAFDGDDLHIKLLLVLCSD
jgi:hypothetical protein